MIDSNSRVLVVIPTFNEQATIGDVVERVTQAVPSAEVLVVDDGSSDRSASVAHAAGATVCRLPYNLGVGGALRVGYRYALNRGYAQVVQIDADGQHDPSDIPKLLDGLSDADIVIGARFAGRGRFEVSRLRRFAMWMLARRISKIAGTMINDATSGFRVANADAIELFARTYPVEYLGATVEALVIAARSGLRIVQIPVEMEIRQGGTPSHGAVRAAVYVLRAFAVIAMSRLQRWPPSGTEEPRLRRSPRKELRS